MKYLLMEPLKLWGKVHCHSFYARTRDKNGPTSSWSAPPLWYFSVTMQASEGPAFEERHITPLKYYMHVVYNLPLLLD